MQTSELNYKCWRDTVRIAYSLVQSSEWTFLAFFRNSFLLKEKRIEKQPSKEN